MKAWAGNGETKEEFNTMKDAKECALYNVSKTGATWYVGTENGFRYMVISSPHPYESGFIPRMIKIGN